MSTAETSNLISVTCANCGAEVLPRAQGRPRFCPRCGHRLSTAAPDGVMPMFPGLLLLGGCLLALVGLVYGSGRIMFGGVVLTVGLGIFAGSSPTERSAAGFVFGLLVVIGLAAAMLL